MLQWFALHVQLVCRINNSNVLAENRRDCEIPITSQKIWPNDFDPIRDGLR